MKRYGSDYPTEVPRARCRASRPRLEFFAPRADDLEAGTFSPILGRSRSRSRRGASRRHPGRPAEEHRDRTARRAIRRPLPAFRFRVLPLVRAAIPGVTGTKRVAAPPPISPRSISRCSALTTPVRTTVIERHARWIAESGAGAIALSWWGPGSFEDLLVHDVMDVMKDHGIAVTFGLEPYAVDRGHHFASDILYLLTTYGERRGWDAFLVLRNPDGSETPVLKGFRCILPATIVDCHGAIRAISGLHTGRRLGAPDRDRPPRAAMGFRPHRSPRRFARFRQDARFGLRRRRNLRQLHRARAIPSSGPSGFRERPPLFVQRQSRIRRDPSGVRPPRQLLRAAAVLARFGSAHRFRSVRSPRARGGALRGPHPGFARRDHRGSNRRNADQPPERFLSHIRELVQRMARGPRLRADEGRGYTHGCRAATRLPQPSLR